ncbi:MAG: tRNA pseudouridine(55) synthase TruB [Oscillatoriophycideae cyanobacterium NC_groundwater_1537_Pr4_S-0.65um_50_18]|nr:tRNA pseudouridine(55) synthase TruB [Oscillatoriophycideae cyanobacterium NC_groundwater_1537_Pr4_S-0.65um_50_18]
MTSALQSPVNGFLNLDKPAGLTSHDCVARVRRLLHMKRVGHGGTLDPAATGVLPIALGKATRLLPYLQHDKAYRGTVRFGIRTATDDLEGEVLTSSPASALTLAQVQSYLPKFVGQIQQIPPSYSAIQVGGRRLYELARAGEAIEAPIRSVEVYSIEALGWRSGEFPELDLEISCGTGTYIRAIARDLGDWVETGGTLAALTRTRSNGFVLENSLTLEALEAEIQAEQFVPISPQAALHWKTIALPQALAKRWQQGQRIAGEEISPAWPSDIAEGLPAFYQIHHEDGRFLGMGEAIATPLGHLLVPKLVWD